MTIKELIEKLKEFDENLEVLVPENVYQHLPITDIELRDSKILIFGG